MKKNFSVISFEELPDSKSPASQYYISHSSTSDKSYVLGNHFLLKGMIFGISLRGTSTLKIDFKEYELKPNMIFTILPNQIFSTLEQSEDNYAEVLFISVDFMNAMPLPKGFDVFNKMKACPCLQVSEHNMNELIEYHRFILNAYNGDEHTFKDEIARSLICALIALISSLYVKSEMEIEKKQKTREEKIVDDFIELLALHHKHTRNATFYSDRLSITPQYLSRTLKKITGRSINLWITEAVILEAKVLLKSTDMTVIQISEELNFSNPSFFIRYFKQYAGITPLKYRDS